MGSIQSFIQQLQTTASRASGGRRHRASWSSIQSLELRTLLAGNVLASVNNGGDLILTGDALGNAVDVSVQDGNVVVSGRENTTINGSDEAFVAFAGATSIQDNFFARLGEGNDVLFVEGVSIGGRGAVSTQGGGDSVGFADASVGRSLVIRTGSGDDVVNLEGVNVNRDLLIRTARQSDTIRLSSTNIGDDVSIGAGIHDDSVIFENVSVADNAWINAWHGHDDVAVMNSNIGGLLWTGMYSGNDFVFIDPTSVGGKTVIRTHRGADTVLIEDANQFGRLIINSGNGSDAVHVDAATVSGRQRIRRTESNVVSDAVRDRELNDPVMGVLTRSANAAAFFNNLSSDPDELTLSVDVSSNGALQSSDTLLTNNESFQLQVTTAAGANVAVDADGDGQFDDGSATADSSGNATLNVTLVHNDTNNGANSIAVQASNGVDDPLTEQLEVHFAMGTVVRFDSSLGTWDVELFDDDAPNTVGGFREDLSRYDNSFVHRSVPNFIVQGGGFVADGSAVIQDVVDLPNLPNEFNNANPPNSNVRGTISTAQIGGDIDSFSGQWFFNTVDNTASGIGTNLDSVPHTPFGRVIGSGMSVVDAINNTTTSNINSVIDGSSTAFTDVPLVNYTAGTVPALANYIQINGITELLSVAGAENTFLLLENTPSGQSVGQVTPSVTTSDPILFDFHDESLVDELRLNADDHFEGDPAAPVVLIEYLSLQCPACAAAHPQIEQLLVDDPTDLLVVRRHLPLDVSTGGGFEHAFEAALAAEAAGRQGMFDEMVDELFARQSEWNNSFSSAEAQAVFEDIAVNTLGLDLTQFNADMNDTALADRINRDVADAGSLGATGTPTYYLNGVETAGTPSSSDIQNAALTVDNTFALNRQSGDLTVANGSDLDFETDPTFTFDVSVVNGSTEIIPVTVNLIDAFGA